LERAGRPGPEPAADEARARPHTDATWERRLPAEPVHAGLERRLTSFEPIQVRYAPPMGGDRGPAMPDARPADGAGPVGSAVAAPVVPALDDMPAPAAPTILRFEPGPPSGEDPARRIVVLDTTWAPDGAAPLAPLSVRDVARRVLARRDLISETSDLLNGWAEASGVIEALTVAETSFWYYVRLRNWMWLQQQVLWLGIAELLLDDLRPSTIECQEGTDEGLIEAIRLLAAGRGIEVLVEPGRAAPLDLAPVASAPPEDRRSTADRRSVRGRSAVWLSGRMRWLRRGVLARVSREDPIRRRRVISARLGRLGRVGRGRSRPLLVVLEHARQQVQTVDGPRLMNPYLGPIVDQLRGSRLDPVEVDIRAKLADDEAWERLRESDAARLLPSDAIWLSGAPWPSDDLQAWADDAAERIAATTAPIRVSGVDLGPALRARVAGEVRRSMAAHVRTVGRIQRLLQVLRPSGILLADEYHRQEWLAAAHAEGLPTAAVQHGMIYRRHNGYIHQRRPASLRLPSRTYLFGQWEEELLRTASVYRADEVRVGGSPRLDLVAPAAVDREAIRSQLGIAPSDRMVVISGTWGQIYRRFHYPITLSALIDRPLPRVHLVIKLHPGEPDDGPYRQVIEATAAAAGFEPPPVTIVQSIDLYVLLAAADAHLGVHSTVLTEAVATGTPNLIDDSLAAADLLGYVPAGVARVVHDGGELLEALDEFARGAVDDGARRAFLDDHFEPGNASRRIAEDLLAWLA
jgi:hypothetical protein